MLVIGISWLLFWGLVQIFAVELIKAALVVGVVFIILGLLTEGVPNFTRKP